MSKTTRRPLAGFTLIELLTVIAIIGILAGIIIPTVGAVRIKAQQAAERQNLSQIGKAAIIYATDNGEYLPDPLSRSAQAMNVGGLWKWMLLLAKSGNLNTPSFYFSKIDQTFAVRVEDLPGTVTNPTNKNQLASGISTNTPFCELVGGLKTSDSPNTPIAWIRGLQVDGTWSATKAPYGDTGGAMVFLGGNMQQFASIDNKLTRPNGKPTSNALEAIPFQTGGNQRVYAKNALLGSEGGTKPSN